MTSYIAKTAATFVALILLQASLALWTRPLVAAEYWVGEAIAVKTAIAKSLQGPRLIFVGGSSALFAVNAVEIERQTGAPTVNFGLHAGLSLERLLQLAAEIERPGDVVVLQLEPTFYSCGMEGFTPWRLRNSLTWDRAYFDALPFSERLVAALTASPPSLVFDELLALAEAAAAPQALAARRSAMAPEAEIYQRFKSQQRRVPHFVYSAYNLDGRGDMTEISGARLTDFGVSGVEPDGVCPAVQVKLKAYVDRARAHGVRVGLGHAPILIDGAPDPAWRGAETRFAAAAAAAGATLVEPRDHVFFARPYFFDMHGHLNEEGRRRRTARLIDDLKSSGLLPAATPQTGRPAGEGAPS